MFDEVYLHGSQAMSDDEIKFTSMKDIALVLDDGSSSESTANAVTEEKDTDANQKGNEELTGDRECNKNKQELKISDILKRNNNIVFTVKPPKYDRRQMALIKRVLSSPYSRHVMTSNDHNENRKYIVEFFNEVKNSRRVRTKFRSDVEQLLRRSIPEDISQSDYIELINALCENYLIEEHDIRQFINNESRKANFVWTMLRVIRTRNISSDANERHILTSIKQEREFNVLFRRMDLRQQGPIESSLHEQSEPSELKNGGASISDLVEKITSQFDELLWNVERQKTLLSAIKIKWDIISNDKRMVNWIENNRTILEWVWHYIVIHFFNGRAPVWAVDVSEKNYDQMITTTFDVIDDNAKELMLDKIKVYGRQHKARPNLKNKSSSYYLSEDARKKLTVLSERLGKNKSEMIEYLITNAFEQEGL